jgi:sec-independent protein translocase protein TatA
MFGLGTQELLIILVLVMIIFGAGKLPQVGSALGKGLRNFKKGVNDSDEEIEEGEIEEVTTHEKKEVKEQDKTS